MALTQSQDRMLFSLSHPCFSTNRTCSFFSRFLTSVPTTNWTIYRCSPSIFRSILANTYCRIS